MYFHTGLCDIDRFRVYRNTWDVRCCNVRSCSSKLSRLHSVHAAGVSNTTQARGEMERKGGCLPPWPPARLSQRLVLHAVQFADKLGSIGAQSGPASCCCMPAGLNSTSVCYHQQGTIADKQSIATQHNGGGSQGGWLPWMHNCMGPITQCVGAQCDEGLTWLNTRLSCPQGATQCARSIVQCSRGADCPPRPPASDAQPSNDGQQAERGGCQSRTTTVQLLLLFVVCKLQEAPLIRDFGHPHGGWGHRTLSKA